MDYYLLDQSAPEAVSKYACRLLAKVYDAGLKTFVLTDSPEQAEQIDQMLWTSSDANFVPHTQLENLAKDDPLTQIVIGDQLPRSLKIMRSWLHLKPTMLNWVRGFARVAELVSSDELSKQARAQTIRCVETIQRRAQYPSHKNLKGVFSWAHGV